MTFNLGSIRVREPHANLRLRLFGGNEHWFGNWEVDFMQLVPITRDQVDRLKLNTCLDPGLGLGIVPPPPQSTIAETEAVTTTSPTE
jgi:hypothetical protein